MARWKRREALHSHCKADLRAHSTPRDPMAAEIQRRKLLILENDRALRTELERMFSDLEVTSGETAEQALAQVRRLEPEVVLFDLGTARDPAVASQSLELLRQILTLAP